MRDQDGAAAADCRVNGEDWKEGERALRAYVEKWPQRGFEARKQYVILQNFKRSDQVEPAKAEEERRLRPHRPARRMELADHPLRPGDAGHCEERMMQPVGLVLPGNMSFRDVIQPLAADIADCFWLIDDQTGPFDPQWVCASPENEAIVEERCVDVPVCRNSSSTCWRPRTFPQLAEHVIVDEQTYFFAMRCREHQVPRRADWLVRHIGRLTAGFFEQVSEVADIFVCNPADWWEIYTHHVEWREKLRQAFPASFERSWTKVGHVPVEDVEE